jgi:hypothetical protein
MKASMNMEKRTVLNEVALGNVSSDAIFAHGVLFNVFTTEMMIG